ncbi:DUF4382 domain-containing protein [Marivirga salinae]|uniref:DUF4382 domain-containing protein n=1 Tax=Marivirga salinarum TaxID=3059078 RepID=A0AA49GB36_9BACT|nr:DUF4382 domain-containing protein [Marivirga sp. BDSF4-3]WKK77360.2 DUF4382 domain-containing protein [Marivirga sp. BDSF4-3]
MKHLWKIFGLAALVLFYGCDRIESGNGRASFYLTDGPLEAENVTEVVISISKVEVFGPEGWTTVKEYENPQAINLLEFQGGETFFLDEREMVSGLYDQIRLGLSSSITSGSDNPPHYIKFEDESIEEITIPSGAQTGYKVVGDFTIPDGGVTSIVIDFDVRKSVVKAGNSGKFILKPTLRLIEDANVGAIEGNISGEFTGSLVVYAYDDGAYQENESEPNADGVVFANAVTSSNVDADDNYNLAFLPSGTYDLVIASFDGEGNFQEVVGEESDVELGAGEKLDLNIELGL